LTEGHGANVSVVVFDEGVLGGRVLGGHNNAYAVRAALDAGRERNFRRRIANEERSILGFTEP